MTAPAAFVGYGLYLVEGSAILGVVVGVVILLVCRFLLGSLATGPTNDGEQSSDSDYREPPDR
ncbi:MAG TPA: hypothetical protein VGH82_15110 [Gaiellaceae bacterium]|jgi:hypothetical protein